MSPNKIEQTQSDAYCPPFIQRKIVKSLVRVIHERTIKSRAKTPVDGDERYEITKFITNLNNEGVLRMGNVAFMASIGCDYLEYLRGVPATPSTS